MQVIYETTIYGVTISIEALREETLTNENSSVLGFSITDGETETGGLISTSDVGYVVLATELGRLELLDGASEHIIAFRNDLQKMLFRDFDTKWARFQVEKLGDTIYKRHKGFGLGCFWTDWDETDYKSVQEAVESITDFYGEPE